MPSDGADGQLEGNADRLALALSGGGHRAALFGLGAMHYVVDAQKNRYVVSLSSVSGGSITNGFTAQQLDFADCTTEQFEADVAVPLASQIARRGTLFAPLATKAYLLVLGGAIVATLIGPWLLPVAPEWRVVAFVAAVVVTAWLAGRRGLVCAAAFRRTLFSPRGRITLIRDLRRRASSVWCSTDLRTGRQVYFGSQFVYGYSLGTGKPADLPLYQVVQASAAFPGGFPPAQLPTRSLSLAERGTSERQHGRRPLVLADGGLYDNMADQWARGFAARGRRWPDLPSLEQEPDVLIVVNASAREDWMPFRARIPLWGELAALLRDMSVLYENTTTVRRQDLVERFDMGARAGRGLRGCLTMIGQSPYDVADHYRRPDERATWPERGLRADAVVTLLGPDARTPWRTIVSDNSAIPTTLRALGVQRAARLLYHAYVVTMCNAHVVLGYPLLRLPTLDRFRTLVCGR